MTGIFLMGDTGRPDWSPQTLQAEIRSTREPRPVHDEFSSTYERYP
jgi:hypothetical protein